MTTDKPNHIYFANRANSKLETFDFLGCIEDCDVAIKIDTTFIKAYVRKARALQTLSRFEEGLEVVNKALQLEPENADLKEILGHLETEIHHDKTVPKDNPERIKIDRLIDTMNAEGAEFSKIRLRFYESTHRGAHAACNIKLGDIILTIPKKCMITEEDAYKCPVGKQMLDAGIDPSDERLVYGKHNYLAVFLLTEIYRKREDPSYKS